MHPYRTFALTQSTDQIGREHLLACSYVLTWNLAFSLSSGGRSCFTTGELMKRPIHANREGNFSSVTNLAPAISSYIGITYESGPRDKSMKPIFSPAKNRFPLSSFSRICSCSMAAAYVASCSCPCVANHFQIGGESC